MFLDVSFEDTDSFWPVIINETASKKWCEKMCTLCEDMNYSRTGICIKCDAGLCKSYFHATCALKHGLTVDPAQQVNFFKLNNYSLNLIYVKFNRMLLTHILLIANNITTQL